MHSIEHEFSYILSDALANKITQNMRAIKSERIVDYYYSEELRLRKTINDSNEVECTVCHKDGDKQSGHRTESEVAITLDAFNCLRKNSNLCIDKCRTYFEITGNHNNEFHISIDEVVSPMKIQILEIESKDANCTKFDETITNSLFGLDLKMCPLSAYKYFKRKIGICGAPSSGKTETSKYLSYILNTQFGANSFYVTEFATSFIQKYRRNPKINDQFFVWHGQSSRESDAQLANMVISDCPTFLSYIYTLLLNANAFDDHMALYISKMYKRVLMDLSSYSDLIFLEILNYEDNNIRYQTEDEALDIQRRILLFLDEHNIDYGRYNYKQFDTMLNKILYLNE